jgi:hypothetical protein
LSGFGQLVGILCLSEPPLAGPAFIVSDAGIIVDSPPGWSKMRSEQPEIVIGWIAPGSIASHVRGRIIIHQTAANPAVDGDKSAQLIAAGMNGQITNDHDTLGGERAWRIQATSQSNTPSEDVPTLEDLICVHNQRLYAIECDAIPGRSYHEQVNFVRDHWKWLPPTH